MRYLILSDAHLFYKKSKIKSDDIVNIISELMEKHDTQKLIILGDFVDLWRNGCSDILIKSYELFDYITSIQHIYIIGNHDYILKQLPIENLNIKDIYIDKNNIFQHGHFLDYLLKSKNYISLECFEMFCKIMCYSNKNISNVLSEIYEKIKYNKIDYNTIELLCRTIYNKKVIAGHYHTEYNSKYLQLLPAFSDGKYSVYDDKINKVINYDLFKNCINNIYCQW